MESVFLLFYLATNYEKQCFNSIFSNIKLVLKKYEQRPKKPFITPPLTL